MPTIPNLDVFGKFSGSHKVLTPMYNNFKSIWDLNRSFHPARAMKIKTKDDRPPPRTVYHRMFKYSTWVRPEDAHDDAIQAAKIAPWVFSQCSDGHYRASPYTNDAERYRRPHDDRYPDHHDGSDEWFGPVADYRKSLFKYTEVIAYRRKLGNIIQALTGREKGEHYPWWDHLKPGAGVPFGSNQLSMELLFDLSVQHEKDTTALASARTKIISVCANNPKESVAQRVATPAINDAIDHLLTVRNISSDTLHLLIY